MKQTHAILIEGGSAEQRSDKALALLQEHFSDDPFAKEKLTRGQFEDLIIIKPEEGKKEIVVKQIEGLITLFMQKPLASTGKACLIPCGERLNEESQNKLLKLLEEPTSGDVVIIMAQNAESLFSTVRSRCMRVWLGYPGLPAGDVSEDVKGLASALVFGKGGFGEARRILSKYEGGAGEDSREIAPDFLRAFQVFLRFLLLGRAAPDILANDEKGAWFKEMAERVGDKQTAVMRKGVLLVDKALNDIERGYQARYVMRGMALLMLKEGRV